MRKVQRNFLPTVGLAVRSNGPGLTIFLCTLSPNLKAATHSHRSKKSVMFVLPSRLGLVEKNLKLLEVWLSLLLIPQRSRTDREWAPLLCKPAPWTRTCTCVRERERAHMHARLCVCVWERKKARDRRRARETTDVKSCNPLPKDASVS